MKDIKNKKIFIGVSWPYANGNIHLGHLAGQNVVCDVFARYHRLKGNDVLMVSGSDSHGAPVIFKAEELKMEPSELALKFHNEIKETFSKLGLEYENYTKTTTENHKIVVQNIFSTLNELGFLEIKESEQYFDTKAGRFLPDRYVRGTCPECGATNARGDECPECGKFLSPEQLKNPYSTLSDTIPVLHKTQHFYINLGKTQKELTKWVNTSDKRWRTWVREFTKGWLKQGLEPRAVTRDLNFGIPVPVEGWEDKVIYVWIEAVVGYLSASIEWAQKQGNAGLWEEFWKNPKCEHYYFIAGGNVPFHTVIWPAELIAYNKKYGTDLEEKYRLPGETFSKSLNLPFDVPANKMLLFKGRKMSKGDGTGITIETLLSKYSPDVIRYFFIKNAPENHDREYKWKDFIEANNNELVANLGNFINRSLTFLYTKFDGVVPDGELEEEVKEKIEKTFNSVSKSIEKCEFIKSAEAILDLGHFANKYFNDKQPWLTIKDDKALAGQTIYNTVQLVNSLRILLQPFTPFASKKVSKILNLKNLYDPTEEVKEKGRVSKYVDQWIFEKIDSGIKINKPEILFEKLEYTDDLKTIDGENISDSKKDVVLIVEKELKDIPTVFKVFENVKIVSKKDDVSKWIKEQTEVVRGRKDMKITKILEEYIKLHDKYSQAKGLISSSQDVIENMKSKKGLVNINTFVDIYNVISALTGISIGAHDLDKLEGNVKFAILEEKTPFEGIGKDNQIVERGEYAYMDDRGIICRLDIKQGERTKVTNKTENVFVIAQGNSKAKKEDVQKAINLLEQAVKELLS